MKKNLLTLGFLALSLGLTAQVICHVDNNGVFFVGENALVYNGGSVQTKGNGVYDIKGNVMVVGDGSSVLKTLNSTGGTDKTDGGNFILRMNNPAASGTSTYGQLYIDGLTQNNIKAIVDKEFRTPAHGSYQQIALPFHNKTMSSLSGSATTIGSLGKNFSNTRYSENEFLTWNNITAVSDNLSTSATTPKSTTYYMFGAKGFNSDAPPANMPANAPALNGTVYTLKGQPIANNISETLTNAAAGVNFGPGGNNVNSYNEKYNTYLGDDWEASNAWTLNYGRNIYQFGNPYLTNLDLGFINKNETGTPTDNNNITSIRGIRYDPGTVIYTTNTGTVSVGAKYINFTLANGNPDGSFPVGDIGLIIKPMQTFVVKLRDNASPQTLNFDNLRRFKNTRRLSGTDYDVTALKATTLKGNTVKQLGVIGLDENGQELARTYYAVYPTAITGHTSLETVQTSLGSSNILGTYEESVDGGLDTNYSGAYWLYINEANEHDFLGKAIPMALYSTAIKSLKFEIRENAELIADAAHNLSTGIGFYYKAKNGEVLEIAQNQVIPVVGDEYSLFYGKSDMVLGTGGAAKPSRTKVVYNGAIDKFVVRFDSDWKKAEIQVYDMGGKLIVSQKNVITTSDFEINLAKNNAGYIVTAVSEKGEKVSSKIIR